MILILALKKCERIIKIVPFFKIEISWWGQIPVHGNIAVVGNTDCFPNICKASNVKIFAKH